MIKCNKRGSLEVICGSMFSGKSEELIRRIVRSEIAKQKVCVFKHRLDNRLEIDYIRTHNGDKIKSIALDKAHDIELFISEETQVIAIDEVQFFSSDIINIIQELVENNKRVIVAGLDLDFKGTPFGCMPILMAIADSVTKLQAVCVECGEDARFSQRLINNKPAKFNDPIVMIGAQECYQARCRKCYVINKSSTYEQALNN